MGTAVVAIYNCISPHPSYCNPPGREIERGQEKGTTMVGGLVSSFKSNERSRHHHYHHHDNLPLDIMKPNPATVIAML